LEDDLHREILTLLEEAISLSSENFDVHIVDRLFDNNVHQIRGYSKCHWQAVKPIIGADGSVYLCAQKRTSKDGIIGNVIERSFSEVWAGTQRQQTLQQLDLMTCPYCVHHSQNQMLEFRSSFSSPHGSFI
jgi:radical SAM protein with 4Fe4S-binding SPASM domain